MGSNSMDDLTLARSVAAGDETALVTLYARYADPLFAFVYHHVDETPLDAEDLCQETWLAALRALSA